MSISPNYFAVLPAAVRYNPKLTSRAVLMYGLIRSLSVCCGEAFASNAYLADTLGVSERTVGRLIAELEAEKYIAIRYEYVEGTKEIAKRYIRLCDPPLLLFDLPPISADAVIPTRILLMPDLSVQAKLLFVEISAVTPTDGYCSRPATFFAELLKIGASTVRRLIKELVDADALRVEMEYKGDTREIRRRRIYMTEAAAIIEKRRQIEQDSRKDGASSNEPCEPCAANTPKCGRNKGVLIFVTTSKDEASPPHNVRKIRRKRKKATEILRL